MHKNNLSKYIIQKIEKGEDISPFLFLADSSLTLNESIHTLAIQILQHFSIDKQSLFVLEDRGESLKIAEVQAFFSQSYQKPRFAFQIFFVENFGRITREAANSCLKVLEEPGKGNIIFLTNTSENGILDTILSRVQIIKIDQEQEEKQETVYDTLLEKYFSSRNSELISYFFSEKLERKEYADFLQALLGYAQRNKLSWDFLSDIDSDIAGLRYGSLSGKYVVDKYILQL